MGLKPRVRAALALAVALLSPAVAASSGVGGRAVAPPGALEPGVSRELARWRSGFYRDVRYALSVELGAGRETISGTLEARVRLPRRVDLVFDWRPSGPAAQLSQLRVNGKPSEIRAEREHLVIPRAQLARGENVVRIWFSAPISASGAALTRYRDREDGSEYLYSLLVPAEASTVFPCFDQPDLKAHFRLEASAPPQWKVIANAGREESALESPGTMRHRFAAIGPISTYLFAFAAGPFEEIADRGAPLATRLYVRRSQLERARREADEVLRLNREGIGYLEGYFARSFPFPKYDLVLLPEFAYGGMEHAGAVFLREEAILFPSQPSANDALARAQLLLHEASHQWFGDLVTMRWFDDLWLKEGFANFMAAKAAEALLPQHNAWTAFHALKSAAYRTDATRGTTAIRQPLENLAEAKSAYGAIVYGKAPAILRQAEFYLGEKTFRRGVRDFLRRHARGSADWADLVRAMERASGRSLARWASAWVERRGMPRLRLERIAERRGLPAIALTQADVLGSPAVWPMRLRLLAANGREHTRDVTLHGRRTEVSGLAAGPLPGLLFANEGDYGYGQFLLDAASRASVLARPSIVRGALTRALLFDSLWESVREAELAPLEYIGLVLRVAPEEADEVTLATLLGRSLFAATRYLTEAQRSQAAPALEQLYFAGMSGERSASTRIAFLRAFMDAGWTDAARAQLKALLAGRLAVPGVALRSRDRFRIVRTLLVRGDPEAAALLEAQAARDRSDDGRRYAFAAAAAAADAPAKARYFERFLGDAALAESWIAESLAPFNAVEHAALTAPYLERALAALPDLKRTRRIFFVNDWLAAFLGGQTGAEPLRTAQRFAETADLEPDLRLKLLEAMDALERAVRIRARFAH